MPRLKPPPASPVSPDDIEQQFYDALQTADVDALMSVWCDEDEAVCVHPGGARVLGSAAIRASFDAIFGNGAVDVTPERVRRLSTPGCAVHSVLEHVRMETPEGPRSAWVIATNVYVQTAAGWRMAVHHASAGSERDVQEMLDAGSTIH